MTNNSSSGTSHLTPHACWMLLLHSVCIILDTRLGLHPCRNSPTQVLKIRTNRQHDFQPLETHILFELLKSTWVLKQQPPPGGSCTPTVCTAYRWLLSIPAYVGWEGLARKSPNTSDQQTFVVLLKNWNIKSS